MTCVLTSTLTRACCACCVLLLVGTHVLGKHERPEVHNKSHCSSSADEEEENADRVNKEKSLIFDLFEKDGYNPLVRPVTNPNETLEIRFSLALSQIISVDEVNQVMKTNVWLQVYWNDYQIQWDPEKYGNIGSIRISPDKVWVPDFVLFNNANGNFEVTYKSNCVLYSTSEVHWIPPAIYHSSCSIDVKYFPFDQQVCEMKFGSWTHKGKALKYSFHKNRDKLDLGDYLKSGSWDIIDGPGRIEPIKDNVTGEEREQIIFQFVLRRKTLFYTVNVIIPCVLISFVTVCVFALPAHGGQKITLSISVLFALVVFLLLVSKILPPSLTIPLIAKYLLFTFIMNVVAIFCTVIIINRNWINPGTQDMPHWVRILFLRELPKYLLMSRPDHEKRWKGTLGIQHSRFRPVPDARCISLEAYELAATQSADVQGNSIEYPQARRHVTERTNGSSSWVKPFEMTPEIHRTVEAVEFIYQHLKKEQEYVMILEDWKYVARVLDRLLLIIFLAITLSGTVGILMNAPHILEFVDQDKIINEIADYIAKAEVA
ncbi:acetylcholine receptor subunit beta-like 1 [Physella acuta]|uniref:acetylcholine receptor subunit beta-like 1 n=1 Tax=Physella acuta TaxID=109671 RepID=UPI0027DBE00B|nr:acetylcholine receptor subunit beta-like 1 [Physella acuta]